MRQKAALARLAEITRVMREASLSDLDQAMRKRRENLARLEAMDAAPEAPDLSPIAAQQAALRYQAWTEGRRSELNILIAGQTAQIEDLREAARRAFGRDEALKALQARLR